MEQWNALSYHIYGQYHYHVLWQHEFDKNKIDRNQLRVGYTQTKCCTLAKSMASLSTCHLEFIALGLIKSF